MSIKTLRSTSKVTDPTVASLAIETDGTNIWIEVWEIGDHQDRRKVIKHQELPSLTSWDAMNRRESIRLGYVHILRKLAKQERVAR